jgi:hypothetical protein
MALALALLVWKMAVGSPVGITATTTTTTTTAITGWQAGTDGISALVQVAKFTPQGTLNVPADAQVVIEVGANSRNTIDQELYSTAASTGAATTVDTSTAPVDATLLLPDRELIFGSLQVTSEAARIRRDVRAATG